ncbi:MAG: hypothetical protein RL111_41 [Pseudomonadota bacterium]|jgi:deoxyribodipyrimidine photo-lyase
MPSILKEHTLESPSLQDELRELQDFNWFAPALEGVEMRLEAIHPYRYAQSRNHIEGAVTRLSPYLTHGLVSVPQLAEYLHRKHRLAIQHKLIYELGWREYHLHVQAHLGDGILQDLHAGPLPPMTLLDHMPEDIVTATSGIPMIDQSIQALYDTGYLHNHARLWLASYLVHLRKVHWRVGADWMHALLLDGELASNHLSWQWVTGTASSKPYLFNAENVARHAPSQWHSFNTVIDKDMETIEWMAQSKATFAQRDGSREPMVCPKVSALPPEDVAITTGAVSPEAIMQRDVWFIHPWSLGHAPASLPSDAVRVAGFETHIMQRWPWRHARWRFVGARMKDMADQVWMANAEEWAKALSAAKQVHVYAHPHMNLWPGVNWVVHEWPRLWPTLEEPMPSFSKWWNAVNRSGRNLGLMLAQINPPPIQANFKRP